MKYSRCILKDKETKTQYVKPNAYQWQKNISTTDNLQEARIYNTISAAKRSRAYLTGKFDIQPIIIWEMNIAKLIPLEEVPPEDIK